MVYTVFYKTSSFAGYCFLNKNSIHPKRRDVFNFKHFEVTLVKFQICSFIDKKNLFQVIVELRTQIRTEPPRLIFRFQKPAVYSIIQSVIRPDLNQLPSNKKIRADLINARQQRSIL